MLSWELHATFVALHPLRSITPDQWALHPIRTGAMPTDGVHAPIATSDSADTRQGSAAPANRSGTTRHTTGQRPVTALLTEAR